jgi:hypothetical protein
MIASAVRSLPVSSCSRLLGIFPRRGGAPDLTILTTYTAPRIDAIEELILHHTRTYAVERLRKSDDHELLLYLLQLV